MRRDRYGEPIDPEDVDDQPVRPAHSPYCRGWIDRDADNPVPCLVCKPHLARSANDDEPRAREEASR